MENPSPPLPRVTIQFCTQCKWMLRAAYFAQELLSTFGNSLGEVALQPSTGGTFVVHLYHAAPSDNHNDGPVAVKEYLLWDRKAEGGFPETKELKKRVRDVIDPSRNLGHVDGHKKPTTIPTTTQDHLSPTSQPLPSPLNPLTPHGQVQYTNPLNPEPSQTTEKTLRQTEGLTLRQSGGVSTQHVEEVKPAVAEEAKGDGKGKKVCEDCQ